MRAFTINFPYKGKLRSAVVSFGPEEIDMTFFIRYLDEDINQIIPGRRITVSLTQGIKSPKQLDKLGEDLLSQTTDAINTYMYQQHN